MLELFLSETNAEDRLSLNANEGDENEYEADDDQAEFHAEDPSHQALQPRWPTRVFAAACVRRIIAACEQNKAKHFDLAYAKEMHSVKGKIDVLTFHLSDLIRMAFIAATSDSDPLRLEGLKTLQDIIEKFAKVPEPEFPGHLLLEQFQAQVGAALRPAFSPDTSSLVTAAACEVCSTWIGSNVARDLNDLRRVHQLLVSSLSKLHNKNSTNHLYNESLLTLEKLSILKAWAEVYIVAMKETETVADYCTTDSSNPNSNSNVNNNNEFTDFEYCGESLLNLVQPELISLSHYWLSALRDHALLSLPSEFSSQLPHDGGAFYTNETIDSSRMHYNKSWPPILYAAALWLSSGAELADNKMTAANETNNNKNGKLIIENSDRFNLLFGICMEALSTPRSNRPVEHIIICLQALYTLLNTKYIRELLIENLSLGIELCNVLHRLILTRDDYRCQLIAMDVLKQIIKAAQEDLSRRQHNKLNDFDTFDVSLLGEGGESGEILAGSSLVISVLEVCLCLLICQMPTLSPTPNTAIVSSLRTKASPEQSGRLLVVSLNCIESLHKLCSPKGAIAILPTVLYLTIGVMTREASKNVNSNTILAYKPSIQAALHCLKTLATDSYCNHPESSETWQKLLQSGLAKVVDLAKTSKDEKKMDNITMMLAVAVFVMNAPSNVVIPPNLQYPCINHFRQCLESPNLTVSSLISFLIFYYN